MIKQEKMLISGHEYIRTYSDAGFRIRNVGTGNVYDEAIDKPNSSYTYEETLEKIPTDEEN